MYWVKSGKEKSVKLVDVHDAIGRDRVILADGGTLNPTILLVLGLFCKTNPHCALQMSSARIASRDHSRDNWVQSVIRSDAHCAYGNEKNIILVLCFSFLIKCLFNFYWLKYIRLHLCKCSLYMAMGMLIGQQRLDVHQFDILVQHFLSMHSDRLVPLYGMELEDSWQKQNKNHVKCLFRVLLYAKKIAR